MTTKSGSGEVKEYQGKPVTPAIPYTFEFQVYDNVAEAKSSEDWPNDSDMLKFVNQTAERSAKAQSYQKAVAELKKAYEDSSEFKNEQLIKAVMAAKGCDRATAEAVIAALG